MLAGNPAGFMRVSSFARASCTATSLRLYLPRDKPFPRLTSRQRWSVEGSGFHQAGVLGTREFRHYQYERSRREGRWVYRQLSAPARVLGKSVCPLRSMQQRMQVNYFPHCEVYFPYGIYRITGTLRIPPDSILQGETWSSIRADSTTAWSDEENPQAILQIGHVGDRGTFSVTNMVVEPGNVYPGAKLVEINMAGDPDDIVGLRFPRRRDCIFYEPDRAVHHCGRGV